MGDDDVTKRVNARDENENNNTGFGVIRIQVASKSARAPLAGSDRYRYCAFAPKWRVVLKSISTPPFSRR